MTEQEWEAFAAALRARLEAGAVAYGDHSFARDPSSLLAELRQEALDLAGWGYVLFVRLSRLEALARGRGPDRVAALEDLFQACEALVFDRALQPYPPPPGTWGRICEARMAVREAAPTDEEKCPDTVPSGEVRP